MGERLKIPENEATEEKKDETVINRLANSENGDRLQVDYGDETKKYKLLTRSEEQDLAKRIKEGDQEALEQLINSNLRLVIALAHQLKDKKNIISDLIQEGNLGLMEAAKRFDSDKGKFSVYATRWILGYMRKFAKDNQSLIRLKLDRAQRKIFSNLRKIERKLEHEGIETSDEMISKQMKLPGVTAEKIKDMRQRLKPILSIDTPVSSDEDSNTLGDYLKNPNISPEEEAQKNEVINHVRETINSITNERERTIIEDRLLGDKTLESVSKKFGVSRERVHQIEIKVKKKLAEMLEKKGIKDHE